MATVKGSVEITINLCKGCELCIVACPQQCLGLSESLNTQGYRYAQLIADTCTGCLNCALVCPDAVITVYRQVKQKAEEKI
ncbi:MAG: 4Fe-4S dicluster domain-containing protein [Bacteroidetes bacterium]|nr:4Fe-4S dicluster domain-containing protein [Bacteroidota bacterium]